MYVERASAVPALNECKPAMHEFSTVARGPADRAPSKHISTASCR